MARKKLAGKKWREKIGAKKIGRVFGGTAACRVSQSVSIGLCLCLSGCFKGASGGQECISLVGSARVLCVLSGRTQEKG